MVSILVLFVVVATTKIDIFKQITTRIEFNDRYVVVVVATTKIDIFKQITTQVFNLVFHVLLLLLPQR